MNRQDVSSSDDSGAERVPIRPSAQGATVDSCPRFRYHYARKTAHTVDSVRAQLSLNQQAVLDFNQMCDELREREQRLKNKERRMQDRELGLERWERELDARERDLTRDRANERARSQRQRAHSTTSTGGQTNFQDATHQAQLQTKSTPVANRTRSNLK